MCRVNCCGKKNVVILLLRNCCPGHDFAGREIDQGKTEMGGTFAEGTKDSVALLHIVRGGAWILIDEVTFEHAVNQDGELSGRGRDRFGFPDSIGESTVAGPERRLRATEAHGRQSQERGGAIGRWLGV